MSNRGASVRIPWQVEIDKKGYIEDRRPNANMDPYVVTRLITDTVCSALGVATSCSSEATAARLAGVGDRLVRWHRARSSFRPRKAVSRGDSQ